MKLLVFTDLDATLLDHDTYSWTPAAESLRLLRDRNASLILVSSKTRAEMTPLSEELGFDDPFIIENGGGIVVGMADPVATELRRAPSLPEPLIEGDRLVFPMGSPYREPVESLGSISAELGCALRGFSAMTAREVSDLTGLALEDAVKAKAREFDEPFVPSDEIKRRRQDVEAAAARRGLCVTAGGRFWHLMGHKGKGAAVSLLTDAYRSILGEIRSIGLGDSPNDFSFLEVTDIPILLGIDAVFELPDDLADRVIVNPDQGPEGWNEAIRKVCQKLFTP